MRRRAFITRIGAGAVVFPLAARAQRAALPVIGFLHSASPEQNVKRLAAYRDGLREAGFVEGQNVAIEYRWAAGQNDKLPAMAADLVRQQVAVIATPGSTSAAVAAKAATATIPIIFAVGADPVSLGLVASLSRPGGNVTGVASLNTEVAAKRLGLIRELLPQARNYFALINPSSALAEPFAKDMQDGATAQGIRVEILRASTDQQIDAAFASLPPEPGNVLVFAPDPFFYVRREHIGALAAHHKTPTAFDVREYVEAGGLLCYGADFLKMMELAGNYTSRILKGEKPADLPVEQPTKFEMAINLKTAKALGVVVPPTLLATADAVIE